MPPLPPCAVALRKRGDSEKAWRRGGLVVDTTPALVFVPTEGCAGAVPQERCALFFAHVKACFVRGRNRVTLPLRIFGTTHVVRGLGREGYLLCTLYVDDGAAREELLLRPEHDTVDSLQATIVSLIGAAYGRAGDDFRGDEVRETSGLLSKLLRWPLPLPFPSSAHLTVVAPPPDLQSATQVTQP